MTTQETPEPGTGFIDYWRRAVNEDRTGVDDWPDADVMVLVRRFLALLDTLSDGGPTDG